MRQCLTVKVKSNFVKKYKSGYPLISKQSLINGDVLKEEGTLVNLVDERHQFLGKGYYGNQNKGYGWIVSNDPNEELDVTFLKKRSKKQYRSGHL